MEHTLWARVGVVVKVQDHEAEELEKDPEAFVKKAMEDGRAWINGETYFPSINEANMEFAKKHLIEWE